GPLSLALLSSIAIFIFKSRKPLHLIFLDNLTMVGSLTFVRFARCCIELLIVSCGCSITYCATLYSDGFKFVNDDSINIKIVLITIISLISYLVLFFILYIYL